MPQTKATALSAAKPVEPEMPSEPEKPVVSEEKVDYDEDEDPEEELDEEVEYEEVEEVEEVEEEEEEGEEEEEEEEEEEVEEIEEVVEEEEEGEEMEEVEDEDSKKNLSDNEKKFEDEKKKHAELLALPPHGSEVYIGGLSHDASDEDLRAFCESVGDVTKVQIMKGKDSGEKMGFAFVTFGSAELASKAIDELNNTELKGKKIKCSKSQAKNRLFIGNVPRSWGEEDLRKVVTDIGPGVTTVELVKVSSQDMRKTGNNRGFAFVNYFNHACALYSRQKMMNPKFKLGDNKPNVSWADHRNADSSASSQVKAVYVKHLPKDVTQDKLKKLFEHLGKITKVVLPPAKLGQEKNRIGFVHFADRSSAMRALEKTEKYELDGQILECSLAKPQVAQKSGGSNTQKSGLLPTYPPLVGSSLVGGTYGALGAGHGAAFAQPMMYGRGQTPGLAMMPMLLPDGRIGYVLQRPGPQPHTPPSYPRGRGRGGGGRSGSKNSGSSSRGRHSNDSGSGRRYRPY